MYLISPDRYAIAAQEDRCAPRTRLTILVRLRLSGAGAVETVGARVIELLAGRHVRRIALDLGDLGALDLCRNKGVTDFGVPLQFPDRGGKIAQYKRRECSKSDVVDLRYRKDRIQWTTLHSCKRTGPTNHYDHNQRREHWWTSHLLLYRSRM